MIEAILARLVKDNRTDYDWILIGLAIFLVIFAFFGVVDIYKSADQVTDQIENVYK